MNRLSTVLSLLVILGISSALAQSNTAESAAGRIDRKNLPAVAPAPVTDASDRDVDLSLVKTTEYNPVIGKDGRYELDENKKPKIQRTYYYVLTVKDNTNSPSTTITCPKVLSSLLTTKDQDFPCDDRNYLKGKTTLSIFGTIYAYFEVFQVGDDEEALADAKLAIGKNDYEYVEDPYGGGK
jgi:hypothetical protein